MKLADNNFMVMGCMGPTPDLMPLDPDGPLRRQSEADAETHLREALQRNVDEQDTYVRVTVLNSEGVEVPSAKAVRNPRRWVCGSEAAQSVLNQIGVPEAVAMLQAPPQEALDMYLYMADRLAPEAPAPVTPGVELQQQQASGRALPRMAPRPQLRPE